jgi:hypothetical protein
MTPGIAATVGSTAVAASVTTAAAFALVAVNVARASVAEPAARAFKPIKGTASEATASTSTAIITALFIFIFYPSPKLFGKLIPYHYFFQQTPERFFQTSHTSGLTIRATGLESALLIFIFQSSLDLNFYTDLLLIHRGNQPRYCNPYSSI